MLLGCIGGDLILAAARVLHERVPSGDDLGGAVSFESAHGSEPGFELAMVTFDRVVRVLLHGVHRRRDQLVQGPRIHRCPVGGDLDRDSASAQRPGKEPSRCGKVAVRAEQLCVPDTRLRSCGAFVFVDETAEAVVSDDVEVAAGRFLQGA